MGDQLSPEVLEAFASHLEGMQKEAIKLPGAGRALEFLQRHSTGFLGNLEKAVRRPFHLGEAWREMGRGVPMKYAPGGGLLEKGTGRIGELEEFTRPAKELLSGGRYARPSEEALKARIGSKAQKLSGEKLEAAMEKAIHPVERARIGLEPTEAGFAELGRRMEGAERTGIGRVADYLRLPKWFGREGAHLYRDVEKSVPLTDILRGTAAPGANRARALAEELSRRGWTGKGAIGKYIPWGSKGFLAGFGLSAVPGIVNAPEPAVTGEGSTMERLLGEVGSTGGMIAGTGVGLVPGLALWGLGHYGGSRAGRILDRYRAGASLPQAVLAPSPQEAAQQLQTIQRYYG